MKVCHSCGTAWESREARVPGVKETCQQCNAYLHCCLNCRYYDTSKPKQCYIPNVELVSDKAGANFCDEFEFAGESEIAGRQEKKAENRDAFNSLFNDGEPVEPQSPDVEAFKKLFGE